MVKLGSCPVAAEYGVNMAIHEDDPCWSIFGLPRIITCEANIDRFFPNHASVVWSDIAGKAVVMQRLDNRIHI